MKVDYIRRDIPEEISEEGGAYIQLVGKSTVGLESSIKEAVAHLYCVGEPSLIEGYFKAIMRSVFEGIQADGHPRSVGDIQFYPVCGGQFDLDKGWDPLVNDVRIKARLVNGVTLDVSDWTFRDVTMGRVAFTISRVSDGTTDGVATAGKDVEINGANFPAKSELTVSWSCGTKGGEVAADKFSATVSRITIDKTAISSLTATENGLPFEVTVKGCYNKAAKKAVYAHVTYNPTLAKVVDNDHYDSQTDHYGKNKILGRIYGQNFDANAAIGAEYATSDAPDTWVTHPVTVDSRGEGYIEFSFDDTPASVNAEKLRFKVTNAGGANGSRTITVKDEQ